MLLAGNSIGKEFTVTTFGESHGKCVGVIVDGCPAGLLLTPADIQRDIDLRRPGENPSSTSAREKFGGFNDWRGGGMFSGRITAAFVMAGAIAKKILSTIGVETLAHTAA